MRFLTTCLLALVSTIGFTQYRIDKFDFYNLREQSDSSDYVSYARYYQTTLSQSNFLTNQFEKEVFEGQITDRTKDYVNENLNETNLQLILNDLGLEFQHYSKKCDAYWTVGLRLYDFSTASLPKDAVALVLNGNAPYENQTLKLDNTVIEQFRYHSLVLGYDKKLNEKLYLGGRLNLLKGVQFRQMNIENSSLYTHPNGTQVDLLLEYSSVSSKKQGTELTRVEGLGATINFYTKYQLNGKHAVSLEIDNLGFVSWKNQERYTTDSLLVYDGIDLKDNDGNTIREGADVNEILGLEASDVDIMYVTPFLSHLMYKFQSKQKIHFGAGVKYYALVENLPQVYIRPGYSFINKEQTKLSAALIVAAGGFSKIDVGLNLRILYQNVFVQGDSFHLERLLSPDTTYSSGFSISVGVVF
jgi:hypothetical protein